MCPCGCCWGDNEEEKEPIKEAKMVPCKYCGTLFVETASFCPHCGARRIA